GKTTLFNRLCGTRAKTSNFPGTTTAMRLGRCEVGAHVVSVMDLPGIYSLDGPTPESAIVRDVLRGPVADRPDSVVVIVDAANMARNMVLVGEVLACDEP